MKNKYALLGSLGFIFASIAYAAPVPGPTTVADLDATVGNPPVQEKVGEVSVWSDTANLYVKYVITQDQSTAVADDWCLVSTDLRVGKTASTQTDYPATLNCVNEQDYTIPITWSPGSDLYITANAGLQRLGGVDSLPTFLPTQATMTVNRPATGATSYFDTTITDDTFLNGTHPGWCVDASQDVTQGQPYPVNVYSSYAQPPAGVIGHPENLPNVNWLINQTWIGQPSPTGLGNYTYGDEQRAIWSLISIQNGTAGLGDWSQARADEISTAALAQGVSFSPSCDQLVGILLVPVAPAGATPAQTIMAGATLTQMGIPCTPVTAAASLVLRFQLPGTGE